MSFSAPQPLRADLDLHDFACGNASIDQWLCGRALKNEVKRASRTFVSLDGDGRVAGFYALSSFAVERQVAGKVGGGMPDPVPAILLGKLAVHQRHQGRGLGVSLLQDAVAKALLSAEVTAAAAMFVHAADAQASAFYRKFGFSPIRDDALSLVVSLDEIAASVRVAATHTANRG